MTRRPIALFALALLLALSVLLPPAAPVSAQVQEGATMTVLRGQVAVIRPDGSAVQPAPSGTVVRAGDEIRTLSETGALITFFVGTEIELGEDTILVVERVSRQGERVDVSLRQVFGVSLNRVQALTDPGSAYRIDAGGAVAVVRGTEFLLLGPTPEGIVVLVCLHDCDGRTTFAGVPLVPFIGYYARVENGRVVGQPVAFRPDRDAGYWNAAYEGLEIALRDLQDDTRGVPAGQVPGGQQQEIRAALEHQEREDARNQAGTPSTTPPSSGGEPCGVQTVSGGEGVTRTVHQLGRTSGRFPFTYDAYSVPDRFDVEYEGRTIYSTGGFVSGGETVDVRFSGRSSTVTVVVTGSSAGTAWDYTVDCPS